MENEQGTERYRLNRDVLVAGNEYDVRLVRDHEHGRPVHAVVTVPGVGSVIVPPTVVTKVEPPLPPEPPIGSIVRSVGGVLYERQGWVRYTWAEICHDGPVTLLVDVEPVELPFTVHSGGTLQTEIRAGRFGVQVGFNRSLASDLTRYFTGDEARRLARALWVGANEYDRAQGDQS